MTTAIYPWQQSAFAQLQKMFLTHRLPNALLLHGSQGVGKLELMRFWVALLLCKELKNNKPCGNCSSCSALRRDDLSEDGSQKNLLIRHSYHPSVIYCTNELNDKGKYSHDIRINQVREFCSALYKTSQQLKIGILWFAERMNVRSADSLLKTLEEPPQNTFIILISHQKSQLPPTILSRCQKVQITTNNSSAIYKWLSAQVEVEEKQVQQALNISNYAPLLALKLLNSDEFSKYQMWQDYLISLANDPSHINQNMPNSPSLGLQCLENLLTNLIKRQIKHSGLKTIADKSNPHYLFKLLTDVQISKQLLNTNVNIDLLMDNILIVWSHITHLAHYPNIIK